MRAKLIVGIVAMLTLATHRGYSESAVTDTKYIIGPIYGYIGGYPYGYGIYAGVNFPYYYGFSYTPYVVNTGYNPTYGAIAYSRVNDKFGYSWGSWDRSSASSNAVTGCGYDDCQGLVWVHGGCAAAVKSATTNTVTWAYAYARSSAESMALQACRSQKATDCMVRAWTCSF